MPGLLRGQRVLQLLQGEVQMNIYEKLQEARVELQGMNLKKSGKNSFAQYDYFELADFMPHINQIMLDKKLTGFCSFTEDSAHW